MDFFFLNGNMQYFQHQTQNYMYLRVALVSCSLMTVANHISTPPKLIFLVYDTHVKEKKNAMNESKPERPNRKN